MIAAQIANPTIPIPTANPPIDTMSSRIEKINVQVHAQPRPFQSPYARMKETIAEIKNPSEMSESAIPPNPRPARIPNQESETVARMKNKAAAIKSMIPTMIVRTVSALTPLGLESVTVNLPHLRALVLLFRCMVCSSTFVCCIKTDRALERSKQNDYARSIRRVRSFYLWLVIEHREALCRLQER